MYTAIATAVPTSPATTLILNYSQLQTSTNIAEVFKLERLANMQMALNPEVETWKRFSLKLRRDSNEGSRIGVKGNLSSSIAGMQIRSLYLQKCKFGERGGLSAGLSPDVPDQCLQTQEIAVRTKAGNLPYGNRCNETIVTKRFTGMDV